MKEILFEMHVRSFLSKRMEPVTRIHVIHPETDGENGERWIESESKSTPGFRVICIRTAKELAPIPTAGVKTFSSTEGSLAYRGRYKRRG